jgi:hypothetical protein
MNTIIDKTIQMKKVWEKVIYTKVKILVKMDFSKQIHIKQKKILGIYISIEKESRYLMKI